MANHSRARLDRLFEGALRFLEAADHVLAWTPDHLPESEESNKELVKRKAELRRALAWITMFGNSDGRSAASRFVSFIESDNWRGSAKQSEDAFDRVISALRANIDDLERSACVDK